MAIQLSPEEQKRLMTICVALVASVSEENLAKRADRLSRTLVDPFDIRDLADFVEIVAPGAAGKVRQYTAERAALAEQARAERARARAAQLDAERTKTN
jgi:hypothetical protein